MEDVAASQPPARPRPLLSVVKPDLVASLQDEVTRLGGCLGVVQELSLLG